MILFCFLNLSTAQSLRISLDDVEELSELHSPDWEQFKYQLETLIESERGDAMRLNPVLNYDMEYLNNSPQSEREQFAFIEQKLRTPGHFRNLRRYRDIRIEEVRKEIEAEKAEWLADMRLGFIRIVLLKEELSDLENLQRLPDRFMDALEARAQERETSLIEEQLLKMSGYQLTSLVDERRLLLETEKTEWLTKMGLSDETNVEFSGSFSDVDILLPEKENLLAMLDQAPGREAASLAQRSAGQSVELEESRRWPSFELRAGYKSLNPDIHGFMAGVSLPIPLLNRNRPAVEQARSQERINALAYRATVERQDRELSRARDALYDIRSGLDQFPGHTQSSQDLINALTAAYEEGEQSLSEVLNALSLTADTYRTWYNQLDRAYEQVKIIEALTGRPVLNTH